MITNNALVQPIMADVAADGRLVRADGLVLRLHLLAGGEDGGILAVPALASLASASHKLQMRFARSVSVADDDDNILLWVETELVENVVRLKIIGWQSEKKSDEITGREEQFDQIDGMLSLVFNQKLLLIAVSGDGGNGSFCIGSSAESIFDGLADGNKSLLEAIQQHLPIRTSNVVIGGFEQAYSVSALPQHDKQNTFIGLECHLQPSVTLPLLDDAQTPTGQIFGHQLGLALRQPLGRIIANAETIGSKLQGPIRDSYATYAKDIADAARHLVTLVDDLGDLEAIERPGFSTAKDIIELGDIGRRVAGLLALKAADHSINILAPAELPHVPATAEFRRVLQIMINLVTNAIRYSPDGTRVMITISQNGDISQICVSDEGKGVAKENREKIFNKFERLGRSGDGGSGLGLYISRRLARAMGGNLHVDQTEQGGAMFTLTLPR
jgi:signal transduction histidine kinase